MVLVYKFLQCWWYPFSVSAGGLTSKSHDKLFIWPLCSDTSWSSQMSRSCTRVISPFCLRAAFHSDLSLLTQEKGYTTPSHTASGCSIPFPQTSHETQPQISCNSAKACINLVLFTSLSPLPESQHGLFSNLHDDNGLLFSFCFSTPHLRSNWHLITVTDSPAWTHSVDFCALKFPYHSLQSPGQVPSPSSLYPPLSLHTSCVGLVQVSWVC